MSMPFSAAQATKRRTMSGDDRLRADEEPSAQREPERRRRARVDRADPLPRALDASAHRRVEDAAARDLEAGEPGAVEDLRDAEHFAGGDAPGERLLREQPDRRVEELRHGAGLYRVLLGGSRRGRAARRVRVSRPSRGQGAPRARAARGAIGRKSSRNRHGPSRAGRYRLCPVGGSGLRMGPRTRRPREVSGASLRPGRCNAPRGGRP